MAKAPVNKKTAAAKKATVAKNKAVAEKDVNLSSVKNEVKPVKKAAPEKQETIAVKARSGNPAKRGEVTSALKEAKGAPKAVKIGNFGPNPLWLVPTMVGLMTLGIAWVVIFYLTASIGGYPLPILNYWNLFVGFALIIAGFGLSTKWK
jgi:hypothetical protein